MGIDLSNYRTVDERIADFKAKHPEGTLQPANPLHPFEVVEINGASFVVVVTAAYRTPDDPRPGIGIAWEPVPGKTPYTKDSEIMNAETSSWGRAIVAVLASESKGSLATSEEVRNRQAVTEHLMEADMRERLISYLDSQDDDVKKRFGKAFGKRTEWTSLQVDAMVKWTEKECAIPLDMNEQRG